MKKIILLISMAFIATGSLFAQDYNQSVGLVVGSLNGLSYKKFIKENVAVQTDLAFGLVATRASGYYAGYVIHGSENFWTFQLQPNLYYQKNVLNTDWGNIAALVGGGMSLGYAEEFGSDLSMGKWGVNAIAGVEFILNNSPITVGLDFRPGYGLLFASQPYGVITAHIFDWTLAASVRYCF
ncbi:MAG: hypothetical protein U0L34_06035 [Paludibacteraceae bacterium]|nr:hypothetical protein [Paludibacteraceae bacterium]